MKDLQPIIEKRIKQLNKDKEIIMSEVQKGYSDSFIISSGGILERINIQIAELELIMNTLNQ